MRSFVDPEELVAAYWQKLARPIRALYKRGGRMVKDAAPQHKSGSDRPVGRARRPDPLRPQVRAHS